MVERERSYLLDPLEGYPATVGATPAERLRTAHRAILDQGDAGARAALATADDLLAADPDLAPARVLAGQVDFALGRFQAVVDRLLPVSDASPSYTASQLLLGRAAELGGDLPLAYAAYRAVAAKSPLAFSRTGELHPRALEIVANRLQDNVRAHRLDAAQKELDLLRDWAPQEIRTFEAARALATTKGDRKAELAAVQGLAERRPGDRALLERRAELELEVGDPGAGLQIVQKLADSHPKDPELAEKLAAAKFRWRLSLLPPAVRDRADSPELTRADLAVLLYWLAPEVRYAKPTEGIIATDVLEHPQRDEIVRVVNLGLMEVDRLHRFSPASPARRATALHGLVRLIARFGGESSCVGAGAANPQPSQQFVCEAAARCGIVPSADDCAPGDALSGEDAIELIRRSAEGLARQP
ncbi:MAG TPA: hypothetical protein VOA87_21965 [Thermoanaerobaculia bacterium]|nr:hypothetical protein [Thermoanaerobaculia bacterium]